MDFVSDILSDGRSFRVFNAIDDYSREAIVQYVDFSIGGLRLTRVFEEMRKSRNASTGRSKQTEEHCCTV
jgi:putative transposase